MSEYKLEKCETTNPNRCQGNGPYGQCDYLSIPTTTYCPRHGGNKQLQSQEMKALHDYRLQKWMSRVDEFAASDRITNLRGEIGILRITLEETLQICKDGHDLLLYSNRIQGLVLNIDKLVNSLSKLEAKQGNFLDKSAALVLAGDIVNIIGRHVNDPKAIDKVSNELIDLIVKLAGKEE